MDGVGVVDLVFTGGLIRGGSANSEVKRKWCGGQFLVNIEQVDFVTFEHCSGAGWVCRYLFVGLLGIELQVISYYRRCGGGVRN